MTTIPMPTTMTSDGHHHLKIRVFQYMDVETLLTHLVGAKIVAFETPEGDDDCYLTVEFDDLDDAQLLWNEFHPR